MNRIDELTVRMVDGELTAAEEAELGALLADDEANRMHLGLLGVEAGLRSLGSPPTVAGETLARIHQKDTTDLERSVMRAISALPDSPPTGQAPGSRLRIAWAVIGVAAISVCVVFAAIRAGWMRMSPSADSDHIADPNAAGREPSPLFGAVLIDQSPDVRVVSLDGRESVPEPRSPVPAGSILTTEADGWAVLQLPDGTQLNLFSESRLKLTSDQSGGRQFGLLSGGLHADVKSQPAGKLLSIVTPHTRIQLPSAGVTLTSLPEQGTRVDLDRGTARLERNDRPAVSLSAGSSAFVPADQQDVAIRTHVRALTIPIREMRLRGLGKLSAPRIFDGAVVAASHWQSVIWHPDGRAEAVPLRPGKRWDTRTDRLDGRMLAFREKPWGRLFLWETDRHKVVRELPLNNRHELAGAVSPAGDWVAVIDPRGEGRKTFRLQRLNRTETNAVEFPGKQIISAMAPSPDGKLLAVGRRRIGQSKGNAVDLIDAAAGKQIARLDVQFSHPIALAFSVDGKRVAVGLSGRVQVWDVERRQRLCMIEQPGCPILHVALNSDGTMLAGTSQGDRVWVWNVETNEERYVVRPGEQARGIVFTEKGSLIILTKDGRISEWDLAAPLTESKTVL